MRNEFTRDDLRANDWVEFEDGSKGRVVLFQCKVPQIPGTKDYLNRERLMLCVIMDHETCPVQAYMADLHFPFEPEKNITKVFRPTEVDDMLDWGQGECVFDRTQEKVLTLQEIAKMAGVPVSSLRIVERTEQ